LVATAAAAAAPMIVVVVAVAVAMEQQQELHRHGMSCNGFGNDFASFCLSISPNPADSVSTRTYEVGNYAPWFAFEAIIPSNCETVASFGLQSRQPEK